LFKIILRLTTNMPFMGIIHGIQSNIAAQNNKMLIQQSRKNLAEWKAEKASWVEKPVTRKDRINKRNAKIRKGIEERKKSPDVPVDWFDAAFR